MSHPVISRWSWAGRVFSRFIPTIILSGSSAQYLLAHAKSSRYHLGRECLPSEPGVACQISQGSQSCRTMEVQSRAPFQGLRCAWPTSSSSYASDASCSPSPGPSPCTGQNTDICLVPRGKIWIGLKPKYLPPGTEFLICVMASTCECCGLAVPHFPSVFFEWGVSPFGNFFQDASGNWNCNNMEIKSSCLCPALLLTGKPHWLFQSLIMATSDAKMYGYTSASWFLGFKQCLWISKVKNVKFNSLAPSSFLIPSSWFFLVVFFNDWFLLWLLL